MVVDSSALVAIILKEPGFSLYIDRIANADTRWISAAAILEKRIVINREKGEAGIEILRQLVAEGDIRVAEFSENQAQLAFCRLQEFREGDGPSSSVEHSRLLHACSRGGT
jgi:ribonuclease VapC